MRGCRQVVSPGSSAVSEVSGVGVDWYGGACVGGWGGPEPRYIKQSRGVLRRVCVWSFESLTLAGLGLGSRCSGGLGLLLPPGWPTDRRARIRAVQVRKQQAAE
jgi:hypothetical protein